jgi:hypothetical protein
MSRPDFSNLSTKKPRDTDVAITRLGQHTKGGPTTAEGPAMAHPRTDVSPAAPPPQTKPLPAWLKWFVVAAVIVTALGFWLMFSNRHTDPTPAPPPAPTTLTPQQKAEADTQKVYELWLQSFSAALTANFDTTKLDGGLVTSEVLKGAQNFIDGGRNYMAPKGISATLTYNTVKVRTVDFTPNQVTSEICAVRNLRLVQNGKDVTTDENGAVHPPNIAATDQKVVYTNSDGKWQISSFEFNADAGSPC